MRNIRKILMIMIISCAIISCSGIYTKACNDCESTDRVSGNGNGKHYYYTNGDKTTTKGWYSYSVNGKKSYVYVGRDGYITNWIIKNSNGSYRYKKWLNGSYKKRLSNTKSKRIKVANRFYYVNKYKSITMKSGWKTSKGGYSHYVGKNGYIEYTLSKNKKYLKQYDGISKMVKATGAIKCNDKIIRYYYNGTLTKAKNNMLIDCLNDTDKYYFNIDSNAASYKIKNYSSSNPILYEIKDNGTLAKVNESVTLRDENNKVIVKTDRNGNVVSSNIISISKTSASIYEGGYVTLSVNNISANDTITWSSSSPSIAKVNNSGKVTGVSDGNATIKATVKGQTVSCSITVKKFIPKLNYTQIKLKVGDTQTLKVTNNAAGRKVSWLSGTPTIASVNNSGVVSAIKPGTAYISVTTKDVNGLVRTNKCKVDVVSNECEHHFDYEEKDYKYYEQCNACGMIFDTNAEFLQHSASMHEIENGCDAPPGLAYRYKTCTICGKKETIVIE